MKYLLLAIPSLLLYAGYSKLQQLKLLIQNLEVELKSIHSVKVDIAKKEANFLVNVAIANPNDEVLNLQTVGLVTLRRILFYEPNGVLIGSGTVNISSMYIDANKDVELVNVPFTTNLVTGFAKLQAFLKNPENKAVNIVLEFEAFNKIYKTKL